MTWIASDVIQQLFRETATLTLGNDSADDRPRDKLRVLIGKAPAFLYTIFTIFNMAKNNYNILLGFESLLSPIL
jgi:hypothetical protein